MQMSSSMFPNKRGSLNETVFFQPARQVFLPAPRRCSQAHHGLVHLPHHTSPIHQNLRVPPCKWLHVQLFSFTNFSVEESFCVVGHKTFVSLITFVETPCQTHNLGGPWPRPAATIPREDLPRVKKRTKTRAEEGKRSAKFWTPFGLPPEAKLFLGLGPHLCSSHPTGPNFSVFGLHLPFWVVPSPYRPKFWPDAETLCLSTFVTL